MEDVMLENLMILATTYSVFVVVLVLGIVLFGVGTLILSGYNVITKRNNSYLKNFIKELL